MDRSNANSRRHDATHSYKTACRRRKCAVESLLSGVQTLGVEEAELVDLWTRQASPSEPDTEFEVQTGHNDPYDFEDEYLDEEYEASLHYTTPR